VHDGYPRQRVAIIPGNHDPFMPGSVWEHSIWRAAANITVFSKSELVIIKNRITF
jgi:hypothetical protein